MKKWKLTWKTGAEEEIKADMVQPAGGAVAFLRLGAAVSAQGQSSTELVKIVNFDEVRSIDKVELLN